MKKKCPFALYDECITTECKLYRIQSRLNEVTQEKVQIEDCVFNLMLDALENLIVRSIGIQQSNNKTQHSLSQLACIFNNILSYAEENRRLKAYPHGSEKNCPGQIPSGFSS